MVTSATRARERSGVGHAGDGVAGAGRLRDRLGEQSLLLLATVFFAVAPLAHARHPDQTWQPGVYDDADFDDVILLVTDGISGLPSVPPAWPVLVVRPAHVGPGGGRSISAPLPVPPLQVRAPPGSAAIL